MTETQSKLLADGFMFLEAPKWHEGALYVSDVFAHKVFRIALDGSRTLVCEVPTRPSGQGFLPDGRHVVVSATDCRLLEIVDGKLRPYADLSRHATGYVNDFAIDSSGRIYAGNFGYDHDGGEAPRPAQLHRVDPDGTVTTLAEDVEFPNGSVVIDDGRTLIVAETWVCRVRAFDLAPDGTLSNSRVFADLTPAQPDGLCADAEGALWVCSFNTGEVLRVLDGGKVTDRLSFEGAAISCVLGGEDGRTLFVTTFQGPPREIRHEAKSAVFTLRVDVPGPEWAAQR